MADDRYTKGDLIRVAKLEGHRDRISERLIDDWVSVGLLDQPERRGLGRGRGVSATWSPGQRDLFLALLNSRQTAPHIRDLCNLPVFAWLIEGEGVVPLRQARRALETWAQGASGGSLERARISARQLLDDLGGGAARLRDRKELESIIVAAIYGHGESRGQFDVDKVLVVLKRVMRPPPLPSALRPAARLVTAEATADIIRARVEAMTQLHDVDDTLFEWARAVHLEQLQRYVIRQPDLEFDPLFGRLLQPLSLDGLASRAAIDLVTTLGFGLRIDPSKSVGNVGSPQHWREHQLTGKPHSRLTDSSLHIRLEVRPKSEQSDI